MSMVTVGTLRRMSREQLAEILLSQTASTVAVIDVRDDDHVGGHIHGSKNIPSSTLDYRIPEIVRTLADRSAVIFHCALSQQRGPSAALRYLRERENKMNKGEVGVMGDSPESGAKEEAMSNAQSNGQVQEVYVLDRGFVGWQEKYADHLLSSINILMILGWWTDFIG